MTQQETQHARRSPRTTRGLLAFAVVVALLGATTPARAYDRYLGADVRPAYSLGGYEGSQASGHFHGRAGFSSYPNHWNEGHGPASDYGHAGNVLLYGRFATPPGQTAAAYQIQRPFLRGAYAARNQRLFRW